MRISDWSSDVCSSDLFEPVRPSAEGGSGRRHAPRQRRDGGRHRGSRLRRGRHALGLVRSRVEALVELADLLPARDPDRPGEAPLIPVDWPVLAAFFGASLLLVLSPGPDTILILRYTIGSGRRVGLATVAGVQAGLMVHTLAAVVGLSLLQIGRAHVCTPVTNAHLVCRLLLE